MSQDDNSHQFWAMPIAKMTPVPGYEQGQGHLGFHIVMRTFLDLDQSFTGYEPESLDARE